MRKLLIVPMLFVTLATVAPIGVGAQTCNVQKGESLWRIAKEYHLDFAKVLELNRHLKNPHLIFPDQDVSTPVDSGTGVDPNKSDGSKDESHSSEDTSTKEESNTSNKQADEVLRLVNAERSKQGLKSLQLDSNLNKIATVKAKDMAVNNYFSHDSPTYGDPFEMMRSFGETSYRKAGENIAAGQRDAKEVMNSWMNSSGHRANILNANYTHLGVGYYEGGSYKTYWVQEFEQK